MHTGILSNLLIMVLLVCALLKWDWVCGPSIFALLLVLNGLENLWPAGHEPKPTQASSASEEESESADHVLIHTLLTQNMGLQKSVKVLELDLERLRRRQSKIGREIFRDTLH
jgi:hypothetical protein